MNKQLVIILLICISCIVITACSKQQNHVTQHRTENGDLQETTSSLQVLPTFLDGMSANITIAYRTAITVKDLLPWIPCYCGCGESAGHKSNLNCFIREIKPDGTVIWDDHATRCGVCMETTMITAKLSDQKVPLKDIRISIDKKYAQGFPMPTDTPFPA